MTATHTAVTDSQARNGYGHNTEASLVPTRITPIMYIMSSNPSLLTAMRALCGSAPCDGAHIGQVMGRVETVYADCGPLLEG